MDLLILFRRLLTPLRCGRKILPGGIGPSVLWPCAGLLCRDRNPRILLPGWNNDKLLRSCPNQSHTMKNHRQGMTSRLRTGLCPLIHVEIAFELILKGLRLKTGNTASNLYIKQLCKTYTNLQIFFIFTSGVGRNDSSGP